MPTGLFLVVDTGVEVADGAVEEKFEFEVGDRGEPLFEGALFAEAADMGPVVEDEYRPQKAGLQRQEKKAA